MAAKTTRSIVFPLALLALGGWIVYLIGLAGNQRHCFPGTGFNNVGNTSNLLGAFTFSAAQLDCSGIFRFAWFIMAFVFVTLIGLLICLSVPHALGTALHFTRPFWVGMVTISTLLMMLMCEAFLTAISAPNNLGWDRTTAAGAIITVVGLIGTLFGIGTHFDHDVVTHKRTTEYETTGEAGRPVAVATGVAGTGPERV